MPARDRDRDRLDKVLVDRGLAQSRERARALILAGKVLIDGEVVDKAGAPVGPDAVVSLREEDHPYVSRGALKLVKGLDHFQIDPAGLVALDVGASTGGFTDVLLRRGATKVYAIDVGYGQLDWKLRNDPRVVVIERENVRYLDPAKVPGGADMAVIDTSFISLTLVLPHVAELLGPPVGKMIVALVKPQFEVGKGEVGKGGVVRDEAKRLAAVNKVATFAAANGFTVHGHTVSPIQGPAGNIEYLILLRTAERSAGTPGTPDPVAGTPGTPGPGAGTPGTAAGSSDSPGPVAGPPGTDATDATNPTDATDPTESTP